ncbi:hypothetical protein ACHAWU_004492 [Discostella pseudostelligera]|uniref:Uncharacterized protein n=1 Tax=Discostella pseudostelligera TaxID=259834 RepID=A0ABD3MUV7_9STRA
MNDHKPLDQCIVIVHSTISTNAKVSERTNLLSMCVKAAIMVAACLSAAGAVAAGAVAADEQKSSLSRFLRKRQNGQMNRYRSNQRDEPMMHELDIGAEDVSFWTRSLQSSLPPAPSTPGPATSSIPVTAFPTPMESVIPPPSSSQPVPTTQVPVSSAPDTPVPSAPEVNTNAPITATPTDAVIETSAPITPVPTIPQVTTYAPITALPTVLEVNTYAPITPLPTEFEIVPTPVPTTLTPTISPSMSPTYPCDLPPEEREFLIRELMSIYSNPDLFDDPTTPQAQALNWITNEDAIFPVLCPNQDGIGCKMNGQMNPMVQRYILAVFYFATNGDNWSQCSAPDDFESEASVEAANLECERVVTPYGVTNDRVGDNSSDAWLSPVNECEWGGVACWGADTPNLNLCVDQLDFENDGLSGELITELSVLNSMRFLLLERGEIGGTIPAEYSELERLLILDMDFNDLTGSIPEGIYDLSALQQMDLNDNDITGTISTRIGDLSQLAFFQVDHNLLSGTIPSQMGLLTNLSEYIR